MRRWTNYTSKIFGFYLLFPFSPFNSPISTHTSFLNFILIEYGHFHGWLIKSRLPRKALPISFWLFYRILVKSSVQSLLYYRIRGWSRYPQSRMNHGRYQDLNSIIELDIKRNSSEISWDSLLFHSESKQIYEGTEVIHCTHYAMNKLLNSILN